VTDEVDAEWPVQPRIRSKKRSFVSERGKLSGRKKQIKIPNKSQKNSEDELPEGHSPTKPLAAKIPGKGRGGERPGATSERKMFVLSNGRLGKKNQEPLGVKYGNVDASGKGVGDQP